MIHRVIHNRENPYFQMNRASTVDRRLSWKAVGLLTYLLGKPDNWVVRESDLINQHTDGRDSVQSGMKELREAGYIKKMPVRDDAGRVLRWEAHIYETPIEDGSAQDLTDEDGGPETDVQNTAFPDSGKATFRGNRSLNETDSLVKQRKTMFATKLANIPRDHSAPWAEEPKQPRPEIRAIVDRLYDALTKAGKLKGKHGKVSLAKWEEDVRQCILRGEFSFEDIERELVWFVKNITDTYTPRIRAAGVFCDRLIDVRDARERWEHDHPDESTPGTDGYVVPVVVMTDEYISEEDLLALKIG